MQEVHLVNAYALAAVPFIIEYEPNHELKFMIEENEKDILLAKLHKVINAKTNREAGRILRGWLGSASSRRMTEFAKTVREEYQRINAEAERRYWAFLEQ